MIFCQIDPRSNIKLELVLARSDEFSEQIFLRQNSVESRREQFHGLISFSRDAMQRVAEVSESRKLPTICFMFYNNNNHCNVGHNSSAESLTLFMDDCNINKRKNAKIREICEIFTTIKSL